MTQILLSSQSDALLQRWQEVFYDHEFDICTTKELNSYTKAKEVMIVLLDILTLPDALDKMLQNPYLKIFALTGSPQHHEGIILLKKGVRGYGNSFLSSQNLVQAVEMIKNGHVWLYPELMQHLILQSNPAPVTADQEALLQDLTAKERETAMHVSQGLSNKEIGLTMHITERTVKAHLSTIYQKLQIKDRLALALFIKGMDA